MNEENNVQVNVQVSEQVPQPRYIQVRRFKVRVPNSPAKRLWLGSALTLIGIIPGPPGPPASIVGITILSIDNPRLRKVRRKSTVWIGRRTWAKSKSGNA